MGTQSVRTAQVDHDSRDFWGHTYALGDLSGTVTSGSSSRGRRLDGQEQRAAGRLPHGTSWESGTGRGFLWLSRPLRQPSARAYLLVSQMTSLVAPV